MKYQLKPVNFTSNAKKEGNFLVTRIFGPNQCQEVVKNQCSRLLIGRFRYASFTLSESLVNNGLQAKPPMRTPKYKLLKLIDP